jgi:hypothetical protein
VSDKAKGAGKKGAGGKGRIPKTIAGVKVPKELRKAGEKLLDEVQRPETQAKIAGALTMAAGAVAAAAAKKRAAEAMAPHAPRPPHAPEPPRAPETPRAPGEGGTRMSPDPQAVADAIGQAAEQVLGRFFGKRT